MGVYGEKGVVREGCEIQGASGGKLRAGGGGGLHQTSPTVRFEIIRMMLAEPASGELHMEHINVTPVYTELEEEVYL